VLKKVLGEHLTATTAKAQRQQTRFRIIAYNAYKKSSLFLFEHFYAAVHSKGFNITYFCNSVGT
ncbi:MAG: hypothetical protein ABH879_00030, partial [archaeon]